MFIRYASAVTSGTFMTLTLFYIMQTLIHMGPLDPVETLPNGILNFTRLIEEEPVKPDEPPLNREIFTESEPTPARPDTVLTGPKIGVKFTPPTTPPGPTSMKAGWQPDGPLANIIRVKPTYPVPAAAKGLEGYVIVRFDVNSDGTVTNVTVVESSHAIFEKAAVNAAARFRYKARVVDGVAQATHGLESRFTFEMEQG